MKNVVKLLGLLFLGTIAIFTFRPLGEHNGLLEQGIYTLSAVIAAASAFFAAKAYGRGPRLRSLLPLAFGLSSWCIADALFVYHDFILHNLPYPSSADYFYLIGYILLFIGLMLEVSLSDLSWKKINKGVYLGAGIFTAVLLSVFSYLTLFSSYSADASFAENLVTIGYTVGDIFLVIASFFLLLVIWEYRGGKAAKIALYLLLGFFVTLIADLIYAIYTDEFEKHIGFIYSLSQYCYILGYLLITYAFLNLQNVIHSFQKRLPQKTKS